MNVNEGKVDHVGKPTKLQSIASFPIPLYWYRNVPREAFLPARARAREKEGPGTRLSSELPPPNEKILDETQAVDT